MKLNCYGILPASVRYDKKLSAGAKLLYVELTAGSDFNGRVEENINYFAKVLGCDSRTVYRHITSLLKTGHIQKEGSTFVLPMGFDTLSSREPVDTISEQDKEFFEAFLRRFELGIDATLDKKDMYYPILSDRLNTFSQNELMRALENRIAFVNASEWHQKEQNRPNATDITLLIKDNDTLLKWLNMKSERNPVALKPIKFD